MVAQNAPSSLNQRCILTHLVGLQLQITILVLEYLRMRRWYASGRKGKGKISSKAVRVAARRRSRACGNASV